LSCGDKPEECMAGIELYGRHECPQYQTVRAFFNTHGVPVEPHELCSDPPSPAVLAKALGIKPLAELIDAEQAQRDGLAPGSVNADEIADWLAQNPTALRVPLIVRGSQVVLGADLQQYECLLY
jgi:arsenate reductase-like glutaredoxin family protein